METNLHSNGVIILQPLLHNDTFKQQSGLSFVLYIII